MDLLARQVTRLALDLTWTSLGERQCANVLTDFTDREGRMLSDRLNVVGLDAQNYLTTVVFLEETRRRSCGTGVIARTKVNTRVVWVCSNDLKEIWERDRTYTVAVFIHEMLHTLGLGENPPSSTQIMKQVLARCALK